MKDKKNRILLRTIANIVACPPGTTTDEEPLIEDNAYIVTQPDLLTLEDVLVSTGFNDNDDVFLAQELIGARGTGRHKPVNIEHDDMRIVGHMTESFVATKLGERINETIIQEEPERLPANFDLVSRAVVYASIFPELAHEIRERAAHNELFVSVEAWFEDYDYIVGNRIVRRNAETSEKLEPVLRINGGDGRINGQRLGRVLRGLVIGGKGLVHTPANKDSVIRSVSSEIGDISQLLEENTIGTLEHSSFVPLEKEIDEQIEKEDECMRKSEAAKKKKKEEKPEAAEEKTEEKVETEEKESDATHHDKKKKAEKAKDEDKEKVKADDEDDSQGETSESSDTATVTKEAEETEEETKEEAADDTAAEEQEQPEAKEESESPKDNWAEKLQDMANKLATLENSSTILLTNRLKTIKKLKKRPQMTRALTPLKRRKRAPKILMWMIL
jgi:hypothetical protein